MPASTQFVGNPSHPARRRTQSLADVAMQLRASGAPMSVAVYGPPGSIVDQILAQLRGAGVVLARAPAAGRVPGFAGTVLQFFTGTDAAAVRTRAFLVVDRAQLPHWAAPAGALCAGATGEPIALLLPAVQSAREAAKRSWAGTQGAGPTSHAGVHVAAGDVNGDWQLWLLARDTTAAGGGRYVLTSVQHR